MPATIPAREHICTTKPWRHPFQTASASTRQTIKSSVFNKPLNYHRKDTNFKETAQKSIQRTIRRNIYKYRYIVLTYYIAHINTQRITDAANGFYGKISPPRLDAAQVGSFHVTPVSQLLYSQLAFLPQLLDPRRDIKDFILIVHSHFKNLDKNFAVQIFIYIFAPCVSYMIPTSSVANE